MAVLCKEGKHLQLHSSRDKNRTARAKKTPTGNGMSARQQLLRLAFADRDIEPVVGHIGFHSGERFR